MKAINELGAHDPIVHKLKNVISAYQNAIEDIANFIEKGKIIEEFDLEN